MSKIISLPIAQYKPIKCQFCGAEYEYEKGDHIHILGGENAGRMANGEFVGETIPMLQCPVCGMGNKLEKRNDGGEGKWQSVKD